MINDVQSAIDQQVIERVRAMCAAKGLEVYRWERTDKQYTVWLDECFSFTGDMFGIGEIIGALHVERIPTPA